MSAPLWLLGGLLLGLAITGPALVLLYRELQAARTLLQEAAAQAIHRADHLGALLDRIREEAAPPAPAPIEPPPPPLPSEIEAALDGFVDPDVQEEMRARAITRLRIDPLADPARVAEELMDG